MRFFGPGFLATPKAEQMQRSLRGKVAKAHTSSMQLSTHSAGTCHFPSPCITKGNTVEGETGTGCMPAYLAPVPHAPGRARSQGAPPSRDGFAGGGAVLLNAGAAAHAAPDCTHTTGGRALQDMGSH